jgi:hypothetical protein
VAQGSGAGAKLEWAFPFTPSIDCRLGSGEVAFHLESGTNGLRISVLDDAGGVPGSTVVESTTVIGEMTTRRLHRDGTLQRSQSAQRRQHLLDRGRSRAGCG